VSRSKVIAGAAIVAALSLAGCTGLSTSSSSAGGGGSESAGRIGTPVSDGKLQFTVTSVDRSKTAGDPTNQFEQETAKGEYVNVHLTVKNTGSEAQTYFSTNQKLVVGGKQFDAASILGVPGDDSPLNPGLGVDTVVSFDVPAGSAPEAVVLHDSAFSGGAKVALS
jgi:archaellum component FlaG (FlaF/FlaG flagellin family)